MFTIEIDGLQVEVSEFFANQHHHTATSSFVFDALHPTSILRWLPRY